MKQDQIYQILVTLYKITPILFYSANVYILDSPISEMCAFSLNDFLHLIKRLYVT
jgi:hypothetical protein